MYNASDRKQIRAAEKAAQRSDLSKIEFLKSMLASPGGRLWFYDLLESCHLFSDIPTFEPYKDAYRQGERNVGLRIFSDIITNCPDQYISMMKDANARRSELDAAISPDREPAAEYDRSPDPRWDAQGPEFPPTSGNE
jgi:hypothetical protein